MYSQQNDSLKEIWCMKPQSGFPDLIEAHYRTVLYDLDLVAYNNCNYRGDKAAFRKSMATMAFAMPSLAMIDPARTREISYNLNLVAKNLDHPLLSDKFNPYDSENLQIAEQAFCAGLYRMVSGRTTYDEKFKYYVRNLEEIIEANRVSQQQIYAVQTISGRFDFYTNLIVMMGFMLHDRFFGTDHKGVNNQMLKSLKGVLGDSESGLFYEYYQTGAFGFSGEELAPSAFWSVRDKKPSANALTINLLHYFDPEAAQRGWTAYKECFKEELLTVEISQIMNCSGKSYLTELGYMQETLFAALWCAREMEDEEFFGELLQHIENLCHPKRVETKVFYTALGEEGAACSYFGLLAQSHQGWKQIFGYDWDNHFNQDYNCVR